MDLEQAKLVCEFFLNERKAYDEAEEVLEEAGLGPTVLKMNETGAVHIFVDERHRGEAEKLLKEKNIEAKSKTVLLLKIKNVPGTMADASKRIGDASINLKYAFGIPMKGTDYSLILMDTGDNEKAVTLFPKME